MAKASALVQRARELERLAAIPDSDIDTSDIPEVTDWRGAEVGRFYRPVKKQVTLRIDADVLDWFKAQGGKYQSEINRVLRSHVISQSNRANASIAENNMSQPPQRTIDNPQIGSAIDIPPVATTANLIAHSLSRLRGSQIFVAEGTMHWSESAHGIDFSRRQQNRAASYADAPRRATISSSRVPRASEQIQFRQVPR